MQHLLRSLNADEQHAPCNKNGLLHLVFIYNAKVRGSHK